VSYRIHQVGPWMFVASVILLVVVIGLDPLGPPSSGSPGVQPPRNVAGPEPTSLTSGPGRTLSPSPGAGTATAGRVAFITNTDGSGVARRSACNDEARLGGLGLAEGVQVTVVTPGTGTCAGWVEVEVGGQRSWVRGEYLSGAAP
jgi:Fe2+ transport system protein FeoA